MKKYKVFNWKDLNKEYKAEKEILIYKLLLPVGFNTMSGRDYYELITNIINDYIYDYVHNNKPRYFQFIIDETKINKQDFQIIYDIVCGAFTKAMTGEEKREDREYRLGTNEAQCINMNYSNLKKWLNYTNKCDIVGMELKRMGKLWKKRMVK